MRRQFTILVIVLVLSGMGVSLLFAGCGSIDISEYENEVAGLNEAAAEGLEETAHLLAEEQLETEGERVEASVTTLEEVVTALNEVLAELEDVKVPNGMEDFHRALINSYRGELAVYEGLIATLEPGGEHAEGEGENHAGEEAAEPHEEETEQPHGEETEPVEEKPAEGSGH